MIEETEDSTYNTMGKDIASMQEYLQQHRYSTLEAIGYTPVEVDQYTGKRRVKTDWSPDYVTGYPIMGTHKIWSPVEWWIYKEWIKTDEEGKQNGISLSPAQQKLAAAWSDMEMKQCFVSGGRDSGKSFLGSLFALWSMTFLNEKYPNYLVSLFAGAKEQTGSVYESHVIPQLIGSHHIKNLLSKYDIIHEIATGKKNRVGLKAVEMKFITGARMIINPASTKAARSKHPDFLWIDEVVEAEDVKSGQVISGAVSSLTAGHQMRILGTSTVHKNPMGWFAQKIGMAQRMMERGNKNFFYVNLSEEGIDSKTWATRESVLAELQLKSSDPTIKLDAEFYGKVVDAGGDIFSQEMLNLMQKRVKPPVFDKAKHHYVGHDPGHGSSLYGAVVLQADDRSVEILDSEFWYRTSPKIIVEKIADWHDRYEIELHSVDASATGMIFNLQDMGWDVQHVPLGVRPIRDMMSLDQEERSMADNKTIGINWINNLLNDSHFWCYPKGGCFKSIRGIPGEIEWYGNQLLLAQMGQYRENAANGKPAKGNDDMIDALLIGMKPIIEEGQLGGYAQIQEF